jgi:hypothetical protein
MSTTPEMQQQILIWRQKQREGTLTREEMRQIVITLREGRHASAVTGRKTGTKAKKPALSGDALLAELELGL